MKRFLPILVALVFGAWYFTPSSAQNPSPKKYVALLSQSSTADPAAVVLTNTLGGTVTWSRTAAGLYLGTLSGAFPDSKTAVYINGNTDGAALGFVAGGRSYDDAVIITTGDGQDGMDGILNGIAVRIEVYP